MVKLQKTSVKNTPVFKIPDNNIIIQYNCTLMCVQLPDITKQFQCLKKGNEELK